MHPACKPFVLHAVALAATLAFSPLANAGLVVLANCTSGAATCASNLQAATPASQASTPGPTGYTTLGAGKVTVQGSPNAPIVAGNVKTVTNPPVPSSNSTVTAGTGVTATFTGTATVANTSVPNQTAAPVIDGSGAVAPIYFTTNSGTATATNPTPNSYTFNFSTPEAYLGLLWGSIGIGDLLTFYSGSSVIAQVTGQDAVNAATGYNGSMGARGVGGSQYTLVNFLNGATFTSVTFSQTIAAAFESANVQYATSNVAPLPEPASIVLLGIGVVGLAAARRRKSIPA